MQKYLEFRSELEKDTTQRNTIISYDDLYKYIDPIKDCYRSLFYFDESIKEHVQSKGSISGFNGLVGVDKLIFDFDNLDLGLAAKDALSLVNKLITQFDLNELEIGLFFSGRKGFAVELKTDGLIGFDKLVSPYYVKQICLYLAKDYSSFDSVIYNTTRLYRIANTQHQKISKVGGIETRLFKVPVTKQQLEGNTTEEIQKYATRPRFVIDACPISNPTKLNEVLTKIQNGFIQLQQQAQKELARPEIATVDESLAPKNGKLCIWKLCQGTYTDNRDNALLRIANYDRQQGMPPEVIKAKLLSVLDLMSINNPEKAKLDPITESDIDRLIRQTFNNDYKFGCNDPLLSSLCGEKCYLYAVKKNMSKVGTVNILEAYNQSTKFYENYYSNLILTGIKEIDSALPMFLGTTNLLVGRPGSGKTSIILNIINNMAQLEIPTLFFSLDMSTEMVLGRLGSIVLANNAGSPQISSLEFMSQHTKQIFNGDFKKAMEKLSKYVWISSKRGMTVKDMMAEVDAQEQSMGRKFRLVIIDHIQLIKSDKNNEFERHSGNAQLITEFAKTRNVCVLGISHAVDTEYGVSAKGTRAWEEECSSELVCFRPFQSKMPQYDTFISLAPKKNRLGSLESIDLYYDPPSGWAREITPEEMVELDRLKQDLNNKEKGKFK
jgi:hypothetical protein